MKIKVNGEIKEIAAGSTVGDYMRSNNIPENKTLVSVNDTVLTADEFDKTVLNDGDSLDLFTFAAGG